MSTFPTTGSFPFQVTSEASKPKVGTLVLTYTLNGDGTITGASILYDPGNGNSSQTIAITFSRNAATYQGVPTTQPIPHNWNVPGQGAYKYATFSFTPPTVSNTGTFTGSASKNQLPATTDTITWEADPSTTLPKAHKAAHKGHK
jgi:hypothetical protein